MNNEELVDICEVEKNEDRAGSGQQNASSTQRESLARVAKSDAQVHSLL